LGAVTTDTRPQPPVAVVDPHTLARAALPLVLPELTFVGSFRTPDEMLMATPPAEVVLLEIARGALDRPPRLAWAGGVERLVQAGHRVCIHTFERSRAMLLGCLDAGATAIAHKSDPLDELRAAILATAAGEMLVTGSLSGLAELARNRTALPSLTERQRFVLSARARGEKFDSIARRLFISRKVAEEHWAVVARKFAGFLRDHSAADLERLLGLEPAGLAEGSLPDRRAG
jgi:two-component system nitrate/nitrite response regulator NarL